MSISEYFKVDFDLRSRTNVTLKFIQIYIFVVYEYHYITMETEYFIFLYYSITFFSVYNVVFTADQMINSAIVK